MTKFTAFAFLLILAISAPAFADDSMSSDASDQNAIYKDNKALIKDDARIARDRTAKAQDKATGNWAGQAGNSIGIGADHVMKAEKQSEKAVDQQIAK